MALSAPSSDAESAANIYWIDQSKSVWTAPKAGGGSVTVATSINASTASSGAPVRLLAGTSDIFVLGTSPNQIYAIFGGWTAYLGPGSYDFATDGTFV